MRALKGWLLTSLVALTAALFGFLSSESGFAWHAFQYPMPFVRGGFEKIYLADFSYVSFISLSGFWLLVGWLGKTLPAAWNIGGMFLALSAVCFAGVALDFLFSFLPLSEDCVENTMSDGLTVEVCTFGNAPRIWIAAFAAISLLTSLLASAMIKPDDFSAAGSDFE